MSDLELTSKEEQTASLVLFRGLKQRGWKHDDILCLLSLINSKDVLDFLRTNHQDYPFYLEDDPIPAAWRRTRVKEKSQVKVQHHVKNSFIPFQGNQIELYIPERMSGPNLLKKLTDENRTLLNGCSFQYLAQNPQFIPDWDEYKKPLPGNFGYQICFLGTVYGKGTVRTLEWYFERWNLGERDFNWFFGKNTPIALFKENS